MLSIQPVNLVNHHSFKGNAASIPFDNEDFKYYPKDAYENDKSSLEQQLDEVNELIENADMPKPVRTFGKVVSIGIGAALGFVGMKYGAQGVVKIIKKGFDSVKNFMNKPKMQKVIKGAKEFGIKAIEFIKEKAKIVFDKIKNLDATKKVVDFVKKQKDKFNSTKVAEKLNKFKMNVAASDTFKKVQEFGKSLKTKASSVTGEKVENGVINLFAVSGGVTGGITALQESVKGAE